MATNDEVLRALIRFERHTNESISELRKQVGTNCKKLDALSERVEVLDKRVEVLDKKVDGMTEITTANGNACEAMATELRNRGLY